MEKSGSKLQAGPRPVTEPEGLSPALSPTPSFLDIEHITVADDPREWSNARKAGRKLAVVASVSTASLVAGLATNIYNPAIAQIEQQLHATSGQISLSLALFILIQGTFPLFWSVVSEFLGRKRVNLIAMLMCTTGCIVAALARSIEVLIGMRCLQAVGTSAVSSLGAAALADIYDSHERGTMMGVYYSAPLLGPSLGPILGGVLTQGSSWRATFWFLAICAGVCFASFLFFRDTYRRERSLIYRAAVKRATAQIAARRSAASSTTQVVDVGTHRQTEDVEAQGPAGGSVAATAGIKLSLRDVNPVKPVYHVMRRMNNLATLFSSGLIYGPSYCIPYTCARTLANRYGYNALKTGLVLLAFGIGSLLGSVLGGRYSDYIFRRVKARNGGVSAPEMRLQSILLPAMFFPLSVIAYGWLCEKHVHIAAICVALFFAGFFSICIYSSSLAYVVDANNGRSSSAIATNSSFRGTAAFIATEIAVPLQESIGDGGLYSMWAGLIVLAELLLFLVWWKGGAWREKWERREREKDALVDS